MCKIVDEDSKVSYNSKCIIGIDYGSRKIGLAVVDTLGTVVDLSTVHIESFVSTLKQMQERYKPIALVAGKTKPATSYLNSVLDDKLEWVDERNSTVEAKKLFFRRNPKHSLTKYIWKLILYLFGAYHLDGWAAAVIARRYLNL